MNAKKILAVFTAVCFLQSLLAPSSAASGAAAPAVSAGISAASAAIVPAAFENYIFSSALGQISDEKNYGSSQVVINMRDLHGHAQVQKNIASIIEKLDEKYKVKALYLEGANAKADFWQFSVFPNGQVKKKALNALLLQGRLAGAQYFAALNDKTAVFGLENAAAHLKNIALLDRIYSKENEYKNLTDKIENEIRWLSNRYLNAQSKSFLKSVEKYNAGEIADYRFYKTMLDYAKRINANPSGFGNVLPIKINEYYKLQQIIDINKLAEKINAKKVNYIITA